MFDFQKQTIQTLQ